MTVDYVMQRLAQLETRLRKEMTMSMRDAISQGEYIEQIDWMCEQIKDMQEKHLNLFDRLNGQSVLIEKLIQRIDDLDHFHGITNRRVDELFPDRMNHHLRLLKLEEAHEPN